MKKTDLAYLAGFFDGEGSIFLTKASRNAGLELRISISQANRWICEKYRMAFGGAIVKDRNSKPDSWKCAWQWRAGANIGLEFLKVVYIFYKLLILSFCIGGFGFTSKTINLYPKKFHTIDTNVAIAAAIIAH